MLRRGLLYCLIVLSFLLALPARADTRIGFVNTDRVFREAPIAQAAQKRLEKEFAPRDTELQKMARQIRDMQADLDRNGDTLSLADRNARERDLANLSAEYQRKLREFREDLNARRNEELIKVQDRARKAIQSYAESERYDLIVEDAVYYNPKIDITDHIIHMLSQ